MLADDRILWGEELDQPVGSRLLLGSDHYWVVVTVVETVVKGTH